MKSLRSLFGQRPPPATAPGERIYAIGDVHGRADLLEPMFQEIARHEADLGPAQQLHIIFIGDVIDRGPDSKAVLEFLDEARHRMPELMFILGNHEEMLLRALAGDEGTIRGWMRVGGAETVESFGLAPFVEGDDAVPWVSALRHAVPATWAEWIASWPLTARSGDYLFAHAGVRPGVSLKRQGRQHFLWGHEAFLDDTRDHGAVIVHGHTIIPEVDIRTNRIGIDTGAYSSNTLSAICLDGTSQSALTVSSERPSV